ncbi:AGPHD1 [Mytilus edulis]|uniref:AGPHD1 n=1 Tax=Mytilus edulis TaxID=6550 RepID=A0A8S3V7I9_MYTED|nr:AGPHD1 [Mytilus edulis]
MNSEEKMSNRKPFEGDSLSKTISKDELKKSEEFIAMVRQYQQLKPILPASFVLKEPWAKAITGTFWLVLLIHGDLNDGNIIVKEVMEREKHPKEKTTYDIVGIIDFLDMQYSYNIVDVAILIAHMSAECTCMDPIDVGGHILAGYMTIKELTHNEKDILRLLICSRLAQLVILNEFTLLIDPHKKSVRLYLENYKRVIWKFWKTSKLNFIEDGM